MYLLGVTSGHSKFVSSSLMWNLLPFWSQDPGNDVQITSSKNQSSETQGRDQMEENLMHQITEPQNVEQTTDMVEEVIPIVVRPGHIRFEPVGNVSFQHPFYFVRTILSKLYI